VQIQLLTEDWPLEILESQDGRPQYDNEGTLLARGLSVRMGIHVGYPTCDPDPITRRMDYLGTMVNRTARINDSANGGQIMCSADIIKVLQDKIPLDGHQSPDPEGQDSTTAYIVDEIKRIGFEIKYVGAKKMKGLELPEIVSLIYPKELVSRHTFFEALGEEKGTVAGSQVPFSVQQINQFGMLCLRLEALSSGRVFRSTSDRQATVNLEEDEEADSLLLYAEPSLLLPALSPNASAHHLMLVLDMLALRIENALSTLVLKNFHFSSTLIRTTSETLSALHTGK